MSVANPQTEIQQKIIAELRAALENDKLALPSLPDVAVKIREAIEDEDNGAREIAQVINMDPAITAKIIKTANSAMYLRGKPVQDSLTAYSRLGAKTIGQLVTTYAVKEVFKVASPVLKKRMQDLWKHSLDIAAISFVLSSLTPGTEPSQTMLAALLHDIGVIAILNNISHHPEIMEDPDSLEGLIECMRAELGASILKKWDFAPDLIYVAECAEERSGDHEEMADMVDVINMAHLHSFIGTPKQKQVPRIDTVPAFKKMALGELTPTLSLDILEESAEQVNQVRKLLNM